MEWIIQKELLQDYINILLKLPKDNVEVNELIPYLLINLAVCNDVEKMTDTHHQLSFWNTIKNDIYDITNLTKEFLNENNFINS